MNRLSSKPERVPLLAVIVSLLGGCLPTDTRPVPASVLVQASSDDALRLGFTTDDGWHVTYSRFLMTLGNAAIDGDGCNSYANGGYARVLDLQQKEPQKVNHLYGLGACNFSFSVRYPRAESIIGTGVTPEEALMMRTAGLDDYTPPNMWTGINTYIVGTATNGSDSKSFTWPFRIDYYYLNCGKITDTGLERGLTLEGQEAVIVDLLVRGETPFQDNADPTSAKLLFLPFAAADSQWGNNDGQITLDELRLVPITQLNSPDAGAVVGGLAPDGSVGNYVTGTLRPSVPSTLGDFVYRILVPASVRYQQVGSCQVTNERPGRRGP